MAKTTKNLVLSLDAQSQSFKPAAHNLDPAQAVEHSERLSSENLTTLIVEQANRHRQTDAGKCQACKKTAEEESRKRNSAGGQRPEAVAPEQESEGE